MNSYLDSCRLQGANVVVLYTKLSISMFNWERRRNAAPALPLTEVNDNTIQMQTNA